MINEDLLNEITNMVGNNSLHIQRLHALKDELHQEWLNNISNQDLHDCVTALSDIILYLTPANEVLAEVHTTLKGVMSNNAK